MKHLRASVIVSIVFLTSGIWSCGTKHKIEKTASVNTEMHQIEAVEQTVFDSVKLLLTTLNFKQTTHKYKPVLDSSGNLKPLLEETTETVVSSNQKDSTATHKEQNKQGVVAAAKRDSTGTDLNRQTNTSMAENIPWWVWIIFLGVLCVIFGKWFDVKEDPHAES